MASIKYSFTRYVTEAEWQRIVELSKILIRTAPDAQIFRTMPPGAPEGTSQAIDKANPAVLQSFEIFGQAEEWISFLAGRSDAAVPYELIRDAIGQVLDLKGEITEWYALAHILLIVYEFSDLIRVELPAADQGFFWGATERILMRTGLPFSMPGAEGDVLRIVRPPAGLDFRT